MMDNPAALRKQVKRHRSGVIYGSTSGPTENGSTDEHSSLLPHPFTSSNGQPMRKDDRAWVRWPANTAWITYQTLKSNYVNVLLVFVPLGIIAGATGWNPTAVFVLNFFAIIPLASLLSFATEELSVKLGQTLGGLLNATFGNAVELIVCASSYWGGTHANLPRRSVSWRSRMARFALCNPACWGLFSPISSSSSDAVSLQVDSDIMSNPLTRLLPPPCPPSWRWLQYP